MGFRGALELLDLGQHLVSRPGLRPRRVDRPALVVDLGRKHDAVGEVRVMRDRQHPVARLALGVHPTRRSSGLVESSAVNGSVGAFFECLKNTLRCILWLFGVEDHS